MKYSNQAQYRNIKRLADHDCEHCGGKGLRTKGGMIVASEDFDEGAKIFNSVGEPISTGRRVFMTCACVRKNLRREREAEKKR